MGRLVIPILIASVLAGGVPPAAAGFQDQREWLALESPHFSVVTDTNREKGERLLADLEARYEAYRATLYAVGPRPFKIRVYLMDVLPDFEEMVPESVKTGINLRGNDIPERGAYLLQGPSEVFIVARDRSPEDLADDVGHSLGHLLLARSVLWQPFWLQEAAGEFVRLLGRDGVDAVEVDDAYPVDDLVEIVSSEGFDDLGDGGAFRRQAYHLLRVLIDRYPDVLEAYFEALGRESGYDAALRLDQAELRGVGDDALGYDDPGLALEPVPVEIAGTVLTSAEAEAALGDLALAGGMGNVARRYYQQSQQDAARLGLALISRDSGQTSNGRRALAELAGQRPGDALVQYHFGALDAEDGADLEAQTAALERAIMIAPGLGRAYSALAMLYVDQDRATEAIALAEQAIDLEPEFADRAFEALAEAHLARGDAEAAREAATNAATLPHSDPDTLEHYSLLVREFYRRIETARREAEAGRVAELRRELDALVDERDPRPEAGPTGGVPIGLVHYETVPRSRPGVEEPRLVSGGLPDYTYELRRQRIGGRVVVDIELDRQGRVSDVRTVDSSDPQLSAVVLDTLRRWRFDPAREDNESVGFSFRLTFTFDLQE